MVIRVAVDSGTIRVVDLGGELTPAIRSTLRLQGFARDESGFSMRDSDGDDLFDTVQLLADEGIPVDLDETATGQIAERQDAAMVLHESQRLGRRIKGGNVDSTLVGEFVDFAEGTLPRRLLGHQLKAAIHLVGLAHGANFSVPGAGKTSVVLAIYEFLRCRDQADCLFVVGPRSCFMAWQTEFRLTLGRKPVVELLAGGDIDERRHAYYRPVRHPVELYLTTYHTLARDSQHVEHLLRSRNHRAIFVIDEAHYMKQDGGVWARAVAATSRHAVKRCLLTGTPFPKSYADGINLFEVLYPKSRLLKKSSRQRIRVASDAGQHDVARALLEPAIEGLYYRVRKSELHLSKPVFLPPISVVMNPVERELYECVERRISQLELEPTDQDVDTIIRLKRGRQVRRRQAVSYAALLLSAVDGYSEDLVGSDETLLDKILSYDAREVPGKIQHLVEEVKRLDELGEKVVIWANFVGTLHKIREHLTDSRIASEVIYGGTPSETGTEVETRDQIIERFKGPDSGLDVLIANPAACAESVSLHKTCSNAIYYDLSYNCAQYLQSLDRIHRVGGSEWKPSYYRFLQYADTFEHQILQNLLAKATRMSDVVDQDFPLALAELATLGFDLDDREI